LKAIGLAILGVAIVIALGFGLPTLLLFGIDFWFRQ
jgi:hypothetical protein